METYTPVDLGKHSAFHANLLREKPIVHLPSQGEHGTKILTGIEGEMLYEHRQAGEAMGQVPGIFISRTNLPLAEATYRESVFGDANPTWMIPTRREPGVPLDRIVLADEHFLDHLSHAVADRLAQYPSLKLYGFNQTKEMEEIAKRLQVSYYGNAEFAAWAGTKIGLAEFAAECNIPTPTTFEIHDPSELARLAAELAERGYTQLVVKVSHSTGGMGHLNSTIDEVLASAKLGNTDKHLPEEFTPQEGGVVQGWISPARSVSLATFVDHDGTYAFTGAQAHLLEGEKAFGAIGAVPIEEQYLEPLLGVGHKLAQGYLRHQAWGPHTMGMLIPPPEVSERLGYPVGVPLVNDENTRPGASTISKAWILAVREGRYGVGWVVSKIKTPQGTKIADALHALDRNGLLIKTPDTNAQGIFAFNGSVLDSGYEDAFYGIAISGKDDPYEAAAIMNQAKGIFL